MRVIFNIHSDTAAKAAGWRAMEIHIKDKREATLNQILKATPLAGNKTMYNYIIKDDLIMNDWLLYVNGITISGPSCLKIILKDNTQIHLMDTPHASHHK
ncbi:MAG: hypothetical protein JW944_06205 [Deltaproteobacteria bacterium]|nr:hypothetical protein [Deltaproteobacteria bacterium]